MNKSTFLKIVFLSLLAVFNTAGVYGGMTVVYPSSTNYLHSSSCPAGDGSSYLTPDPVKNANEFFLLDGVSQKAKEELAGGDTSFAGWTFDYTNKWGSANGTLHVDIYKSIFYSNHSSGAVFQARYIKGAGDPEKIRWIQYVKPEKPFDPDKLYNTSTGLPSGTNGPIPAANGGFIDPYPNDTQDDGPFYCHSGAAGEWSINKFINGSDSFGNYDLKFEDSPQVFHPPVSSDGMQFELYLVGWDGAKKVEFLGGVQWGFHGACVPEPGSLMLVTAGTVITGWIRRKRYI